MKGKKEYFVKSDLKRPFSDIFTKSKGEVKLWLYDEAKHLDKSMHFYKMKDKFANEGDLNCVKDELNSGSSRTKPS